MSFNYDFMSNGRRKHCPQPPISSVPPVKSPKSQDAHLFPMSLHVACNSTSLMPDCDEPYSGCPFNASLVELPINLDDMFHDWDMDNGSQSSATILSRSVSPTLSTNQPLSDTNHTFSEFVSTDLPARLTESRHCFIYPLHEPGERIAERTQQLRARTAAILRSLPATVENITDAFDNYVPQKHQHLGIYDDGHPLTVALSPKLRRVSGIPNMRNTFRGGDPVPIHPASISRTELFKASFELDTVASSSRSISPFSACSSVDTLVDLGHALPQSSGDLKTLYKTTVSSTSITSKSATKSPCTFLQLPSPTCPPTYTSKSMLQETHLSRHSLIHRPHCNSRVQQALRQDNYGCARSGDTIWSCAKIAQSAVKRAARQGYTPRKSRLFSGPSALALPL